jgi:hypothetical protein
MIPLLSVLAALLFEERPEETKLVREQLGLKRSVDDVRISVHETAGRVRIMAWNRAGRLIGQMLLEKTSPWEVQISTTKKDRPALVYFIADRPVYIVRHARLADDWQGKDVGYAMYVAAARRVALRDGMFAMDALDSGNTSGEAWGVWVRLSKDLPFVEVDVEKSSENEPTRTEKAMVIDPGPLVGREIARPTR